MNSAASNGSDVRRPLGAASTLVTVGRGDQSFSRTVRQTP
jgi:hypothetical protein